MKRFVDPENIRSDKEILNYRVIVLQLISQITKEKELGLFLKGINVLKSMVLPRIKDATMLKKLSDVDKLMDKVIDKYEEKMFKAKSNRKRELFKAALEKSSFKKGMQTFNLLNEWLTTQNYLKGKGDGVNDEA